MRDSKKFWCWLVGWVLVAALFVFGRLIAPELWDLTMNWPFLALASLWILGIASMIANWGRSSADDKAVATPESNQ